MLAGFSFALQLGLPDINVPSLSGFCCSYFDSLFSADVSWAVGMVPVSVCVVGPYSVYGNTMHMYRVREHF